MTSHDHSIIEKRKKNRTKREAPFDSVHAELDRINEAYEEVKDSQISNDTIYKSLSIRTVTCLEVYLRDKITTVVESTESKNIEFGEKRINPQHLLDYKANMELRKIKKIVEENLWADLVVDRFNFQNLGGINKPFNEMDVDMLNEIKRMEVKMDGEWQTLEDENPNFFNDLSTALNSRHEFTHDLNPEREIDRQDFIRNYDALHRFIDFLDIYIDTQLLKHHGYWDEDIVRMK